MQTKSCEVVLISDDIDNILKWLEKIKESFTSVCNSEVRECNFNEHGKDFRTNVYFTSNLSKNKTYEAMNKIKANPIKFYS